MIVNPHGATTSSESKSFKHDPFHSINLFDINLFCGLLSTDRTYFLLEIQCFHFIDIFYFYNVFISYINVQIDT